MDDPIPWGWFCVAVEGDIEPGELAPTRAFGRDLVVWCDDRGHHHAHDAHCPHLGTHLGVTAIVDAGELVCASHGWRFDATGRCTNQPVDATLHSYPVIVRNGLVFAWHDPSGGVPQGDVPEVAELTDAAWAVESTATRLVDAPLHETANRTLGGARPTPEVHWHGPGFARVHVEGPGSADAWHLVCLTPVDARTTLVRSRALVRAAQLAPASPAASDATSASDVTVS